MKRRQESVFRGSPDIVPSPLSPGMTAAELVDYLGGLSFEARNVHRAARLFQRMIEEQDVIWLGIAGAGIAGGMGGMVNSLLERGFVDVICSTGAQVYHDLHFAFGLPVKAIPPRGDDDVLREHGDVRIYDIGIRDEETLQAQDRIIRQFVRERHSALSARALSSWEFNYELGLWVLERAEYPERSFVACAAAMGVPLFWDSHTNHSIAMNLVRTDAEGFTVSFSAQADILDSAAVCYSSGGSAFVELGGGGPKNFIQQTGPTISQILEIDFAGADRGLQIGTASEREGSLSGCTFSESVTWGKYRSADEYKLAQVWGEYSVVFPLVSAYVLERCKGRVLRRLVGRIEACRQELTSAARPGPGSG